MIGRSRMIKEEGEKNHFSSLLLNIRGREVLVIYEKQIFLSKTLLITLSSVSARAVFLLPPDRSLMLLLLRNTPHSRVRYSCVTVPYSCVTVQYSFVTVQYSCVTVQ